MRLPQLKAAELIKRHESTNPFEIATKKSIQLVFEPLGMTYGYFHTYKRISLIHINSSLDYIWQRFTCAHELGHRVLHPGINTPFLRENTLFSVDKIEREAHEFAVALLLGRDCIQPNESVQDLFIRNGVPTIFIPYYRN